MGQSGSWSINLEENLGTNLLDRIEQNDSENNDSEDTSRKKLIVEIQQNNSENVTTEDENERDLGTNLLVGIERSDVKNINLEENLSTDLEVEIQQKDLVNVTTEDEREIDVHEMDVNVDLKIMSKGEANVKIDLDDPKDSKDMDFEREDDCTSKLLGEENAKKGKEKRIGDLSGEENVEIIKEQKIDGYLPYKPGQHLTMKSWRMEKSEDEKNIEDIRQYAREASIGMKTATHISRNQNSDKYLMTEEEFVGSEKSDSITRTEATNFVNKNEDFTSYSNSKEEIMESEEYNLNATIETPYLINRNKNLPPYSISKEKIMGTKKPNFITRDYTPITLAESSSNCCFQIIIKYYEDGEMSRYLKSLKPGDITYFRGPYGDFQYLKNHKHILAICMGTGLAPIYPIFKSILNDETDETFLKLLYGSKDPQSIILRDELRDMAKFWNFGAEMFLTEGKVEGEKFGENFRAGRIGEKCVYENLKPKQLVLVCGSEIFTQEIVRYLSEFDRWRVEYFVF
ncbi:uncharacterized protein LOC111058833 [Nilaparvata lugens]|uniref:uncharacterized protein LOC111058833 n=1 Tax=Nilaparvata lugens TaxID=108931 RepID=UPI00193D93EB|nr:uncharacterized protein LOC111058833 [Nilaparvata lugens]